MRRKKLMARLQKRKKISNKSEKFRIMITAVISAIAAISKFVSIVFWVKYWLSD
jgi:hypothetical protein